MQDNLPPRHYVHDLREDWQAEHGDIPMPPQFTQLSRNSPFRQPPTSRDLKIALGASEIARLYDEMDGLSYKIMASPYQDPESMCIKLDLRNRYVEAKGCNIIDRARNRIQEGIEIRRWRTS